VEVGKNLTLSNNLNNLAIRVKGTARLAANLAFRAVESLANVGNFLLNGEMAN
jgi:hypothetical protein